jgi:ABC-type transport system involved in multi-copper enzyme maturation permease subunit
MTRLLQIEFQKIWKNKASRVLTIAYFVLLSLLTLISIIDFNFIGIDVRLADLGFFNFPFIWHGNTYIAAVLKIFLAVVIVSMMSNEYSYGTLKQNLIDGLSKKEFIQSKFITVILFSSISAFFIFIITLVLGLNFSSYNEFDIIVKDLDYIFAYFIKLVGFFSFCLFLGILIKRSAFALGFLILWNIIEFFFIVIIQQFIPKNIVEFINRLLPLESMSQLILNPIRRFSLIKNFEQQIGAAENLNDYSVDYLQILIVICWIVIFVLMSYKILQKRDL